MRLFGAVICAAGAAANLGFGIYFCLNGSAYLLPINLIGAFWGLLPALEYLLEYLADRK